MKNILSGILAALVAFSVSLQAQTLQFDASVYGVSEGAGTVTLTIRKDGAASSPVSVHYATSDGFSATAPNDYTATSGDVTFAPNETSKQITVPIVDDAVFEENETFYVTLSDPVGAAVRDPWTAQVSIQENDSPPLVRFGSASYSVNEGAGTAILTIKKEGATEAPTTVYYKTRDGTARASFDYTALGDDLSASVIFAPAETSIDVQIPITDDIYREPSETFDVYVVFAQSGSPGVPRTATVTVLDDDPQGPLAPAQAMNISTRAPVESGDRAVIGGFIITGNNHKSVVLRGMGPSLAHAGLPPAQVLLDPVLTLHGPDGSVMTQNDNWKDDPAQRAMIEGTIYQPTDDRESVIVAILPPGLYTTVLTGKGQTSGIGLVEVYDSSRVADAQLANISTRGHVGSENDVMIGGFTLGGDPGNVRVAVRGLGPSLANAGLSNVLPDPVLELHNGDGTVMASNNDWQSDPVSAGELTARGLALPDPRESGLFLSLPPGQFTAIVTGRNGGTGIGLVEIYNLQ